MGRPPGSKNGAGSKQTAAKKAAPPKKAAAQPAAEPRTAAPMEAAPSNGPAPEEKRQYLELYRKHRRTLASIMEEASEERGNGRSLLKQFENKGGNPKMLRRMWELTDMTQGEAEAEVTEYLGYAVDIGIRVSFDGAGQGSLDDVLKPTTEATEAINRASAYEQGYSRAKDGGQVTENPKKAGSEAHQQWHRGFSDRIWEQENPKPPEAASGGAEATADPA